MPMTTTPCPLPPGVRIVPGFLAPAEAAAVLAALDGRPSTSSSPSSPWEPLAGRRVAHFLARFDFATRGVGGDAPPLPPPVDAAVTRAAAAAGLLLDEEEGQPPSSLSSLQVTANDYPPGSGIHWHVDSHSPFGPALAVLSLGSGVALELRQPVDPGGYRRGSSIATWRRASVWVPANSLLVLDGEARHGWEHAIIARKTDDRGLAGGGSGDGASGPPVLRARRVSLTIRTLRASTASSAPCACAWPALCDAQGGGLGPTRDVLARAAYKATSAGGPAAVAAAAAVAALGSGGPRSLTPPSTGLAAAAAAAADVAAANPADLAAAEAAAVAGLAALQAGGEEEGGAQHGPPPRSTPAFERALVRAVYDRIAPHFAGTRVALWPQVAAFVADAGPSALILDVGCGNGKYLGLARPAGGCAVLAGEPCAALAAAAAASGPPGRAGAVVVCDGLDPVWRPGWADAVLCIAVVHHLASPARRSALIARCALALAPGRAALITAWARPDAQPAGKDASRAARWRPLPGGGPGDFLVPWHEPPGWVGGAAGGGRPSPSPGDGEGRPPAATPLPPLPTPPIRGAGPGGALTGDQRAAQSAADRARQPPPAAWRFYHATTGEELREEAEVGAALATCEAAGQSGGDGAAYAVRRVFLDRGNWCVEVEREL